VDMEGLASFLVIPYFVAVIGWQTITNSRLSVAAGSGGTPQPMFGNSSFTWRNGEIDLGTTATGTSFSTVTLVGTTVRADGFTDAQVIFATGSHYILQDNSGISIH